MADEIPRDLTVLRELKRSLSDLLLLAFGLVVMYHDDTHRYTYIIGMVYFKTPE